MSDKNFVHLHVHTEYSLLDGLSKVKHLVKKVKEQGSSAVAITDHGSMYGAIEFYKACTKEEIKPIIGMEGYVVNGDHKRKESKADRENFHLVLLAKNFEGYQNLMKLSTIAHLEGYYYRPRFSKEALAKYSKGLICLSACPAGEIGQLILEGAAEEAVKKAQWYQQTFGQDNYYLEIQRHNYKDYFDAVRNNPRILEKLEQLQQSEDKWVPELVKLSRSLGLPLVATNDAHYINQDDAFTQDALVCISTGKNVSDLDRMRYVDTPTFYLRSPGEMSNLFADLPDAISNTIKVADQTELTMELGKWYFPEFELPPGKDASTVLRETVYRGLPQVYENITDVLHERIKFELDTIITKGYAPYFLMLADLVNWCTDHGIITNTRGSAAGSVVSYIMGITTVDPIKYLLPFERFLNPFRPSPPDIDLDIADDRREELIAHVTQKYGFDKVAQICTFGRMMAKASIRDIGRVLGHPYSFPDRIAKLIPPGSQAFAMTISKALDTSPELKTLYDTDAQAKEVIDLAQKIEGNARHISIHAAGTVVSPTTMTDYSPLQKEPSGEKVITQYEMHACEDVGLVKFDILGIRNLSILGAARDIVQKSRGIKVDLRRLPLDDAKVFEMLARGETMGVFQMGGSGMTKWLKELHPTRLEDLMIMIAIFRPGPMANIPDFISRKHGKTPVSYMHPKMEKFLDKSFGILVYQDDILFTALELAGYDWGSVDKFRKAVGKKIPEEMAKQHEIFVAGCQKHSGMSKEEAEKIWDLFVPFQGYGFNKAHAAAYGVVSYQTAYLKAHYPVEYMTALFTAESGNTEKVVEAVDECRRMGVVVLAPDINLSQEKFTIEDLEKSLDGRAIRFGLSAIKNVGDAAIHSILEARDSKPFTSLTDFCLRVDTQKVNRKVLESLIKSGALDSFGKRAALLDALDKIRAMGTSVNKMKSQGQFSLFGDAEKTDLQDNLPDIPEFDKPVKLGFEKELLGFYLTEHPHAEKLGLMKDKISHSIPELFAQEVTGQRIVTGGIIDTCRNVVTKSGNLPMCFAKISAGGKSIEAVVFPKTYAQNPSVWQVDNPVLVTGKIENRQSSDSEEEEMEANRELTLIVDSAVVFENNESVLPGEPPPVRPPQSIYIPKNFPSQKLVLLNKLFSSHKGSTKVDLIFENGSSSKVMPLPYGLSWSDNLKSQVDEILRLS